MARGSGVFCRPQRCLTSAWPELACAGSAARFVEAQVWEAGDCAGTNWPLSRCLREDVLGSYVDAGLWLGV